MPSPTVVLQGAIFLPYLLQAPFMQIVKICSPCNWDHVNHLFHSYLLSSIQEHGVCTQLYAMLES